MKSKTPTYTSKTQTCAVVWATGQSPAVQNLVGYAQAVNNTPSWPSWL